jgi:broad specificity phosphatase PhoE
MGVILLVRHGQARWDAEDYDQLSELGEEQSRVVGRHCADSGFIPDVVVSGDLKRHLGTAEQALAAAGWDLEISHDRGWNEFDHHQMLSVHQDPIDVEGLDAEAAFQVWFESACARWTSGEYDADYDEPFAGFSSRVDVALRHLVNDLGRGKNAVVFTSGGPICWVVASLLGGSTEAWMKLVPVIANASITKLVVGQRGVSLSTFNEHGHFDRAFVSYR